MGLCGDHGVSLLPVRSGRRSVATAPVPGQVVVVLGVAEGVQRQVDQVDMTLRMYTQYTQYKLYGTGYMGHKMGLVEIPN